MTASPLLRRYRAIYATGKGYFDFSAPNDHSAIIYVKRFREERGPVISLSEVSDVGLGKDRLIEIEL